MLFGSSWTTRLSALGHLSTEDEGVLSAMTHGTRCRRFDEDFAGDRETRGRVLVVVSGLACKSHTMANGRRQILSYLFPGDMTSPDSMRLPDQPGHAVSMLVPSEVALLDRADINDLRRSPGICHLFERYSAVREAILSEWQVNVGLRSAQERISHLLCEMYARLELIGYARHHVFRLMLTQAQLAESTALSPVHVNRVLMGLRRQQVLAMGDGIVTILDHARLCEIAGFHSSYLKCEEEKPVEAVRQARSNVFAIS